MEKGKKEHHKLGVVTSVLSVCTYNTSVVYMACVCMCVRGGERGGRGTVLTTEIHFTARHTH